MCFFVFNQITKAQEAERVFKIVLAGDAAVGKSSFIMRLCKNKFVTNLNSTLGKEYLTEAYLDYGLLRSLF